MNKKIIGLSVKLFNAVPKGTKELPNFKKLLKYGVIADEFASYATEQISDYLLENKLSGEQLNATFHKSWRVIRDSTREELFIHQILHYLTTYGTNFTSDYIYIPAETLELPEVKNMPLKIIKGIETKELVAKSLAMLTSGIALKEDTIDDLLELLSELGHQFETVDNIKNKEALVKIIAQSNIYPSNPVEFLRYLVFLTTKSTLLIKNRKTIAEIKKSAVDISVQLNKFGLKRCAEIFNRFKPLWLAFKAKDSNKALINEISRLSKRYHKPMQIDVLNSITSIEFSDDEIKKALKRVNNFRKIRLLNALNTRMNAADSFLYRIRNGKSYSSKEEGSKNLEYYTEVFNLVYQDLVESLEVNGVKIKYPESIDYALPSTEKMFIGNFPTGTKITSENLVSGVYWENDWGASDLDLSALSLKGKVGWNSAYKSQGLLYSGDVTNAPKGGTELLYTSKKLSHPALSVLNIYMGLVGCKFKFIIGTAPKVGKNYMFKPDELILEAESSMIGRNQILGIFLPEEGKKLSFILVNAGFGNMSVSANGVHVANARNSLFYQYRSPISLRKLLIDAGAVIVDNEEAEISLMPQKLQKDTIINLLR